MEKATPITPLLSLLGAGAMLGCGTILAKLAPSVSLGPFTFITLSVSGAALLLLAAQCIRRASPSMRARNLRYYFVAALLSLALPNLIIVEAVPRLGASFIALTIAFPPLLTYLLALALRLETFDLWRAAGVMLALSGAALVAARQLALPDADGHWIMLALMIPVLLAAGNIYRTLDWPPGAQPRDLAPGMVTAAAIALILLGFISGNPLQVSPISSQGWLIIAAQSLAFTIQFQLFFILQRSGGPVLLSLLGAVAAIFAVPLAILALGEPPPPGLLASGILIAAGIALVAVRQGARR